jgi:hypothetical protein
MYRPSIRFLSVSELWDYILNIEFSLALYFLDMRAYFLRAEICFRRRLSYFLYPKRIWNRNMKGRKSVQGIKRRLMPWL